MSRKESTISQSNESQSYDKGNLKERVRRKREKINYDQILKEVQITYPAAFTNDEEKVVPLKIGIYKDILKDAALMNKLSITRTSLRRFMFCYVSRLCYLNKLLAGNPRYDLNGKQIGEVSKEQEIYANLDMQKLQAELE